ncbi:MAG: AraC family transcriptional regulator [Cytophagales bacterium]|nr:AraC family transcriptional regulator [Cytophagales bacterium]
MLCKNNIIQFIIEGELTLKQIAWKLGYSSVHHLSNQFRKVTNMTVSEFRKDPKMPPSTQRYLKKIFNLKRKKNIFYLLIKTI